LRDVHGKAKILSDRKTLRIQLIREWYGSKAGLIKIKRIVYIEFLVNLLSRKDFFL